MTQIEKTRGSCEVPERPQQSARWIMELDRLVHEPSRLAILTIIRPGSVDYLCIKRLTGLSKGNLSNHLAKLERAGFVAVEKHFKGKKPVTTVSLTRTGKETIEDYWHVMGSIAMDRGVLYE